jgi:DNA modification methylase
VAGNEIYLGDNLPILQSMPAESFQLIYIDPPFNTGRSQVRTNRSSTQSETGTSVGFSGKKYDQVVKSVLSYDDEFADYWGF